LDSSVYIDEVVQKLKNIEVREKKIVKQFGNIDSGFDGFVSESKSIRVDFEEELPNIVEIIQKEIGLCRNTIIEIFQRVDIEKFTLEFIKNSDSYVKQAIEAFEDVMFDMLSKSGLVYKKIDEFYEFSNIFPEEISGYKLEISKKGLYEAEQYDSDIEKNFINCADISDFKIFTKLPNKFKIKTPLGSYNPDFAVVKLDESEGSFIVETKGSDKKRDSRAREDWQMKYAKKHFELIGLKYRDRITDCVDL
jgi:type III restriction enzyme